MCAQVAQQAVANDWVSSLDYLSKMSSHGLMSHDMSSHGLMSHDVCVRICVEDLHDACAKVVQEATVATKLGEQPGRCQRKRSHGQEHCERLEQTVQDVREEGVQGVVLINRASRLNSVCEALHDMRTEEYREL
eukprot:1148413-Pelagomonas_calceolata.AAC.3